MHTDADECELVRDRVSGIAWAVDRIGIVCSILEAAPSEAVDWLRVKSETRCELAPFEIQNRMRQKGVQLRLRYSRSSPFRSGGIRHAVDEIDCF